MKQTLREQVELLLKELVNRQNMLDKHVQIYVAEGNLADAAINQIKRDQITMIVNRVEDILR